MGHAVEVGYDGRELEVHVFDNEASAVNYVTHTRGYTFEKHETWGFTNGFDFYLGQKQGERACVRFYHAKRQWQAVFWNEKEKG